MYSAREIYKELGYVKWETFHKLIKKAIQIIKSSTDVGVIAPSTAFVKIGSGATREICDYKLDNGAIDILKEISINKLKKTPKRRSETIFLSLLEKYYKNKNIKFDFQYRIGEFVFDCRIDDSILVEFDEPHHNESRQMKVDNMKNDIAGKNNYRVIRITVCDDIVDMICKIDKSITV